MAMISCANCSTFLGNLPVEYGSEFLCGNCTLQKLDEMTLDEHIIASEYDETFGYHEADCGE